MMDLIRLSARRALESVNLWRNQHDDDVHFIHNYCIVMAFYLGHYEGEKKEAQEEAEKFVSFKASRLLAYAQVQTWHQKPKLVTLLKLKRRI